MTTTNFTFYLPRDTYDAVVNDYRTRHGYDNLSDEQKAAFDEKLDKTIGVQESSDGSDIRSDAAKLREEAREKYGYNDMTDDQKAAFDEKLDQVYGPEDGADDSDDQPEKVLVRRR